MAKILKTGKIYTDKCGNEYAKEAIRNGDFEESIKENLVVKKVLVVGSKL